MQLHAKNDTERRLLEYLEANASPALREKIAALPDGDRFGLGAALSAPARIFSDAHGNIAVFTVAE